VFTAALRRAPIRAGQKRIDLRLVEVGHHGVSALLERDAAHLCAPVDVLGAVFADVTRQSVDGGQSLVACGNAAPSRGFDVAEEVAHQLRRHIGHREPIHGLVEAPGREGDELAQGITAALLGVMSEIALAD
jgi:hypothetical protein